MKHCVGHERSWVVTTKMKLGPKLGKFNASLPVQCGTVLREDANFREKKKQVTSFKYREVWMHYPAKSSQILWGIWRQSQTGDIIFTEILAEKGGKPLCRLTWKRKSAAQHNVAGTWSFHGEQHDNHGQNGDVEAHPPRRGHIWYHLSLWYAR